MGKPNYPRFSDGWSEWEPTNKLRINNGVLEQVFCRERYIIGYGHPYKEFQQEWRVVPTADELEE